MYLEEWNLRKRTVNAKAFRESPFGVFKKEAKWEQRAEK